MPISVAGWISVAVNLVAGVAGSMLYKAMLKYPPYPPCAECEPVVYDHAYLQTFFMYIGQFLNILLLRLPFLQTAKSGSFSLKNALFFALPTVIDVIGSTLYNLGLNYAYLSICGLVRNCSVVFVALLSCVRREFRSRFDLPYWVGMAILIIGMLCIFISSYFGDNTATNQVLGVLLVLVGSFFSSMVFVIEEIVISKIECNGLQVCTSEGFWGTVIYAIALPILNFVPINGEIVEPIDEFAYQMSQAWPLPVMLSCYVLSIIFYSASSLEITRHISAVARSMFDSAKVIFVWTLSFCFGWESWDNLGTPLELLGFVGITIGILVYNEVVHWIPHFGKKYERVATDEPETNAEQGLNDQFTGSGNNSS